MLKRFLLKILNLFRANVKVEPQIIDNAAIVVKNKKMVKAPKADKKTVDVVKPLKKNIKK